MWSSFGGKPLVIRTTKWRVSLVNDDYWALLLWKNFSYGGRTYWKRAY